MGTYLDHENENLFSKETRFVTFGWEGTVCAFKEVAFLLCKLGFRSLWELHHLGSFGQGP